MEPVSAPPGSEPAPRMHRAAAYVADLLLCLGLLRLAGLLLGVHPSAEGGWAGLLPPLGALIVLPLVIGALAVPATCLGGTLGQLLCGLVLVDARGHASPPRAKVWQWVATKQFLWWFGLGGNLFAWLFYLTILTDRRGRSLFDDWADLHVARRPRA